MRLLEITQDGAGVVLMRQDEGDGFYTDKVESCIVYAFYGDNALCVVHDTGQLSVPSIRKVAQACGVIDHVYCAQNSLKRTRLQDRAHRERKKKIFSVLKCSGREQEIDIREECVAFLKDGRVIANRLELYNVEPIPSKPIRHHINVLNNLFSDNNSQAIPTDVQYVSGQYTAYPKMLKSRKEMEDRAQFEFLKGDPDYRKNLKIAIDLGII